MLRCCFPFFCAALSWESLFRRALNSQNIIIDLIPVKKPNIVASISWFVDENVEIVLASGVKGTSPDEVTGNVKQQAVCVLQQCGNGDVLKGRHNVRNCVEGAKTLRNLLHCLDLRVRLRLWYQACTDTLISSSFSSVMVVNGVACEAVRRVQNGGDLLYCYCAIYIYDAWELHCNERHIKDVARQLSVSHSLCDLLNEALQVVRCEAERKLRQFATASYNEVNLLLSAFSPVKCCSYFNTHTVEKTASVRHPFLEDLSTPWLLFPTSYKADFEFMQCKNVENPEYDTVAGSFILRDDVENVECWDLPLMDVKDKAGIVYSSNLDKVTPHMSVQTQELIEESGLQTLEDSGAICRTSSLKYGKFVPQLVRFLWAQPLLHALLLQSSGELLCGSLTSACAEDYINSCGRLDIDIWLCERGRHPTVPMMPRCLEPFDALCFLRECLPLEYGVRAVVPLAIGPLCTGYYVATTTSGRVVTAVGCFHSAALAVSALLPWYAASPLRPAANISQVNMAPTKYQDKKQINLETERTDLSTEQRDTSCSLVVRVVDVEASLKKCNVVSGTFTAEKVEYFNVSGKMILRFEHMDTLQGMERFIRYIRRGSRACFVSVSVNNNSKAPSVVLWRALAGVTPKKSPPYSKTIRLPVPLIPDAFFSFRYASLVERGQKEEALLSIFAKYSEDAEKWPLQRPAPCFFNLWRLTRGIIKYIRLCDPLFHYTIERLPGNEKSGLFTLRIYSKDKLEYEVQLEENVLLQQVRRCLVEYASKWNLHFHSVEVAGFALFEIKKSFAFSYKTFLTTLLQHSEIVTQRGNVMVLELYITVDVKISLAEVNDVGPGTSKDLLCVRFLEQQFPELLRIAVLLQRVDRFLKKNSKKEVMFRCINASKKHGCTTGSDAVDDNSYCSAAFEYAFRWELQELSTDDKCVKVLEMAEGPSRFDALAALMNKLELQLAGGDNGGSGVSGSSNNNSLPFSIPIKQAYSIEEYQKRLANMLAVSQITHEYDMERKLLIVKSIRRSYQSLRDIVRVIRVIPLGSEYTIGVVMHSYYRRELELGNQPTPQNAKALATLSLSSIYGLCQSCFTLPLPPLEDSLATEKEQNSWKAVLRLPAKLFALDHPKYVEYVCFGRKKQEGKRNVLCYFYRAVHGETPARLQQALSEITSERLLPTDDRHDMDVSLTSDNKNSDNICDRNRSSTSISASNVVVAAIGCKKKTCNCDGMNEKMRGSCDGMAMSLYNEILGLVCSQLQTYVGYKGVAECRLSYITGFSGRYVPFEGQTGECVELFCTPLRQTAWLPLQLLSGVLSCACKLFSKEELKTNLLRGATTWPSLFLNTTQSERLFCTTFLRRYLGLWIFEENDIGDMAVVPGALYLIERTRRAADGRFEATLLLVQTPLQPSSAVFRKVIASHRGATGPRAASGMWSDVALQIWNMGAGKLQEDVDEAVLVAAFKALG